MSSMIRFRAIMATALLAMVIAGSSVAALAQDGLDAYVPDADTVVLFHFDGDTLDSSGNGHDGTASGGIGFV